jgi:SAM-dependent methyltransferase
MTYILGFLLILYLLAGLLAYFKLYSLALYLAFSIIILSLFFLALWLFQAYRVFCFGNPPYVRSNKKIIARILAEIKIAPGSSVYELGCGDARFLRILAQQEKVKAIGYEYFLIPYLLAVIFNFFSRHKIKIFYQDFFKANLSAADYIFCFLMPKAMERLESKLQQELKPGALVISNTFAFKNWQPEKTIKLDDSWRLLNKIIYIYRK